MMPAPSHSMTMSMMPNAIVIPIFMPVKSALNSPIDLQIFSVITAVKNGTAAVKRRIAFRAVHFPEKHVIAAANKNAGMSMLENPYIEKSIVPSKNKEAPKPAVYAIKSKGCSMSAREKTAAKSSNTTPAAYFSLFKRSIDTPIIEFAIKTRI